MDRSAFLFASIVSLSMGAVAGGDSWEVRILNVAPGDSGATTVTLEPIEERAPWSGCRTATIQAAFRPEPFGRRTWSKDFVSEATHREALARLSAAAKTGAVVRIGSMGNGLVRLKGRCTFESWGLALVQESDLRKEVYSFHDAI